ncbi:unnamed protein product [Arctia plantaginis]|uniref:Uncharacterized protein n=1 Tax=Arctia plantaginis TaxID=874455 RepID=A0A8S0ZV47_ARCPL|nr:unnamed protein product [Arctia plantaginis]CAB3238588.1 unnamed protein product [Arctia plantaginis]
MNNGIKPTRLWYLTGRKHFMSLINGRLSVQPKNQHPRNDYFMLMAFLFPGVFGIVYSYLEYGPPKGCIGGEKKSEDAVKDPPCPPVPCPPIQKPKPPPKCPSCED